MNDNDFKKVVVDIFKKCPHRKLNEECVKVWRTDRMSIDLLCNDELLKFEGLIRYNK